MTLIRPETAVITQQIQLGLILITFRKNCPSPGLSNYLNNLQVKKYKTRFYFDYIINKSIFTMNLNNSYFTFKAN